MNKILLPLLLGFMYTAAPIFACERGTITSTNDVGSSILDQEMVVIRVSPEIKEIGTQTEEATLLEELELVGDRELSQDGRLSIGTQVGSLKESTYESVRRAMKDDQMEKAMAMKKKAKYIAPCYCIVIGVFIYLSYFLPR